MSKGTILLVATGWPGSPGGLLGATGWPGLPGGLLGAT